MKFKNDKYRKVRGGWTRFLEIHCQKISKRIFEKCKSYILNIFVNMNAKSMPKLGWFI
jgi:hypothetical protein